MLRQYLRAARNRAMLTDKQFGRVYLGIAAGGLILLHGHQSLRTRLGLAEWQLTQHVRKFTTGAQVAYDVGSNQGYYVLAFCRLLGRKGRVCAFEANPTSITELTEVLEKNELVKQVEVVQGFVGDVDTGEMLTLDRVMEERGLPAPDIVKIDVEGAELQVLRGMTKILTTYRPNVILEVHSLELETECIQYLRDYGYNVKIVKIGWLGMLLPEVRVLPHNRWIVGEKSISKQYAA